MGGMADNRLMYPLEEIAADLDNFRQAVDQGLAYRPLYVKFKLIWRCNLRCGMCNHWREDRDEPLTLAELRPVVDDLAALGCRKVHITGGEPTLHPELPELIAYMSARDIRVNITTNGTLLTKNRARALAEAGLRGASISLDSPEARLHDKVRGVKGAWKKTVKGARRLARYLDKHKGKIRINTVVGRANYASLGALPDLARELGAATLNLIPLDDHTGERLRLNKQQIMDYNERIAPEIAAKGLAFGLLAHEDEAYPFGRSKERIALSKAGEYALGYYEENPCFAPFTHALINHDGQVSICCMLRDRPVLGNLRQQSFRDIWHGEAYGAIRQLGQRPLFAACRQCDDFLGQNQQMVEMLQLKSANMSSLSKSAANSA